MVLAAVRGVGRVTASKVWPSLLASQARGKILEIVGDDIPVRLRLEIRLLAGAVLERARNECRRHALGTRRREVVVVSCDQHGFSGLEAQEGQDRKSTRLNSSHLSISYALFCLTKT